MLVLYVSGHGYGHAARVSAIIEALWRRAPRLRVAVRTQAPRMMFPAGVEYHDVKIDSAVVESADALAIDNERSVANIRELLSASQPIIERELHFLRQNRAVMIVGDIPFLAGTIARAASLPSVAMGNFLWDWIFADVAPPDIIDAIRDGYSGYSHALRFPFSHSEGWDIFPSVADVALVTPRSTCPRSEIRAELGLANDTRPTVLIGGRTRLSVDVLDRIRRECSEFVFLTPDMRKSFSDLLRASDIVAAKIGYSLAAECIAEDKRLLYPPRLGFREEHILVPQVSLSLAALPISIEDWSQGNWKPYLNALLKAPKACAKLGLDGADQCASAILTVIHP